MRSSSLRTGSARWTDAIEYSRVPLAGAVIDEEIGYITGMGAEIRYSTPICSMRELLAGGFDAVFVGSGAPRGKNLDIPGRQSRQIFTLVSIGWNPLHSGILTRSANGY